MCVYMYICVCVCVCVCVCMYIYLKTGHDSNIDDFRILYKSHDQTTLPIWEHIYIKRHRPNLNKQNDAVIFYLIC